LEQGLVVGEWSWRRRVVAVSHLTCGAWRVAGGGWWGRGRRALVRGERLASLHGGGGPGRACSPAAWQRLDLERAGFPASGHGGHRRLCAAMRSRIISGRHELEMARPPLADDCDPRRVRRCYRLQFGLQTVFLGSVMFSKSFGVRETAGALLDEQGLYEASSRAQRLNGTRCPLERLSLGARLAIDDPTCRLRAGQSLPLQRCAGCCFVKLDGYAPGFATFERGERRMTASVPLPWRTAVRGRRQGCAGPLDARPPAHPNLQTTLTHTTP